MERLAPGSPLRSAYQGAAWASSMYDKLFNARITLNHHIGISGDFANNMRLYEATGVGSLLLTDQTGVPRNSSSKEKKSLLTGRLESAWN